jgi:hypothetical protein
MNDTDECPRVFTYIEYVRHHLVDVVSFRRSRKAAMREPYRFVVKVRQPEVDLSNHRNKIADVQKGRAGRAESDVKNGANGVVLKGNAAVPLLVGDQVGSAEPELAVRSPASK